MVSFNTIPDSLRAGLFFAEVDGSRAGTFSISQTLLLLGHKLAGGSATEGAIHLISDADQAGELTGRGSMLHAMVIKALQNNPSIEIKILPVTAPDGTAATATITLTGPATAAGVLPVYVGGRKIALAVADEDTDAEIATALAAAITADVLCPATATATDEVVTLTALHKGVVANGMVVEIAPLGELGGEVVPAGVTATPTAFASGAGVPDLATALVVLGDDPYDFIVTPFTDATSLNDIDDLLNGVSGRWSYASQLYGHAFGAKVDTQTNLATFGNSRNGEHVTVVGLRSCPAPVWELSAAVAARASTSLGIDPAQPLRTLELIGIRCRSNGARFPYKNRNALLYDGIASLRVDERGTVRVDRLITTYQQNAYSQPDNAWLDVTTPFTLMEVMRRLRRVVEAEFPRMKLANDDQPIAPGSATVTPKIIRGRIIAEYQAMQLLGLVENLEAFKANLVVERNADDPNRVDVLFAPDLVNQLRIFAVLAQFRLQYPTAA